MGKAEEMSRRNTAISRAEDVLSSRKTWGKAVQIWLYFVL
jgi:hypothetical protein